MSGGREAVDANDDDPAGACEALPKIVESGVGSLLCADGQQAVDGKLAQHGSHERLADPGAAGRPGPVVGEEPGADDRGIADSVARIMLALALGGKASVAQAA